MRIYTRRFGAALVLRRAFEGKIGALNFLIALGFLLSLLLLFVSLHVHFETVSRRIDDGTRRRNSLRDEKTRLISLRNDLVAPERILPLAEMAGLGPGSPQQVHRVACYERVIRPAGSGLFWASSDIPAVRSRTAVSAAENR